MPTSSKVQECHTQSAVMGLSTSYRLCARLVPNRVATGTRTARHMTTIQVLTCVRGSHTASAKHRGIVRALVQSLGACNLWVRRAHLVRFGRWGSAEVPETVLFLVVG